MVRGLRPAFCALAFGVAFVLPVSANHAWGTYHWNRTVNPVVLQVGDNVSGIWDQHLSIALSDWDHGSGSYNDVLDLVLAAGGTTARRCRPTAGRIEVCNDAYGQNGWLGVAQIWVSGNHITQATTKLNDTYFTDAYGYNTAEWRQLVMCQEIGHDFGLNHQDEVFDNANLGSCMDYTNLPGSNQHPNAHDFEQLEAIYAHLDAPGGGGGGGNGRGRGAGPQLPPAASSVVPGISQREWGTLVKATRRHGMFHLDFGSGNHIFTFVIWA